MGAHDSVVRLSSTQCRCGSSGRTGRQLDLAEHRAAVLVDSQMYCVVRVETHQLHDAAKYLPHTDKQTNAAAYRSIVRYRRLAATMFESWYKNFAEEHHSQ